MKQFSLEWPKGKDRKYQLLARLWSSMDSWILLVLCKLIQPHFGRPFGILSYAYPVTQQFPCKCIAGRYAYTSPKDIYRNVHGYIISKIYKLEAAQMFINNRLMNCGINQPSHIAGVSKLWPMGQRWPTASLCLVHELNMVFRCLHGWGIKEYVMTWKFYRSTYILPSVLPFGLEHPKYFLSVPYREKFYQILL